VYTINPNLASRVKQAIKRMNHGHNLTDEAAATSNP
jgi:hypothetical protein